MQQMVLDLSIAAGPGKEGGGGSHLFLPCESLSSLMGMNHWHPKERTASPQDREGKREKGRREEERKQEWKGNMCSAVKAGGKKEGAERSRRNGERAGKYTQGIGRADMARAGDGAEEAGEGEGEMGNRANPEGLCQGMQFLDTRPAAARFFALHARHHPLCPP